MPTSTQATARRRSTIPTPMRAAATGRFGPPDVLSLHTLPVPKAGPHEVLIALHAAGVGIWDARIRDGTWATGRERFPLVLGTDGAGVIAARGARVRRFELGDRVWAYAYANPKGGFYAEYVAVNVEHVAPLPSRLDMLQGGAGCVTGLTAQQGIDDHLGLRNGETVLVFGASGAVGTLAVQFAKRRGARVIGTARTGEAAAVLRELSADAVVDPQGPELIERLRAAAPDGLDAALALTGAPMLERCLDLVRAEGRVAYPNGVEPEPQTRPDVRIIAYDAEIGRRQFEMLDRAVEEAGLRVPIAAAYPLEQAAHAHTRVEQAHVIGRMVLRTREEES
jgi:NADPH2:quinone reductase